jgi:hypothetical protein
VSATGSVGLLPLSQRLRWASGFRLAVAAAPVLTWLLLPATRTGALEELVAPAAGLAVVALLGLVVPSVRSGRRVTLAGLAAGLLLDGAYLGWAFLLLGGLSGPIGQVMLLHTIAATLLLSFRTGLKLATWHSMVLLVVLQAQVVGLSPGPLTGEPFPTVGLASLLAVLWAAALTTASFAAVNERELRRRRYDVEVLLRLAHRVESSTDMTEIAGMLADVVHEELLASSTLVVVHPDQRSRGEVLTSSRATTATAVRRVGSAPAEALQVPDSLPGRSLVADAVRRGSPRLARRLHPVHDGWVAALLPGAENLLVVPFSLDQQVAGALVLVAGRRGTRRPWLPRSAPRIERRRAATAQQATAHAAQALGRAALFTRLTVAADTDGLTGLANRRTFDGALQGCSSGATTCRSPCCCWTSTSSSGSTTRWGTRRATTRCGSLPPCCRPRAGTSTWWPATAGKSSPSCFPASPRRTPCGWPSGSARLSRWPTARPV